jgi:ABC-type sugar transport system ATPase subunit
MGMCDRIVVMSKGEIRGVFERSELDQERILLAAFQGYQAHQRGSG